MKHYLFTVAILVFGLVMPSPAFAAGTNTDREARKLFQQGVKAFEATRVRDALDAFKRAYSLRPSYRILYNIAQAEAELGRPHLAIEAFEGYLADGGTRISPQRKTLVLRELAKLRVRVGEVAVEGQQGAEVWIDGERKGYLPLAGPIVLPEGRHRLIVRKGSEEPCEREILVRGGRRSDERCLSLRPDTAVSGLNGLDGREDAALVSQENGIGHSNDLGTKRDGTWFLGKVAPWVATGIGAASLVAAVICAWKTSSLNAELQGACTNGVCPPSRQDDVDALPRLAGASDAMFVVSAVFAAGAVTLFIAPWKHKEEKFVEEEHVRRDRGEPRRKVSYKRHSPFSLFF